MDVNFHDVCKIEIGPVKTLKPSADRVAYTRAVKFTALIDDGAGKHEIELSVTAFTDDADKLTLLL